ncbi:MAG: cytochrome-c peroxidase [Methylococcaceae bacterium]|nr:MAG: cytochrome-c peroxidase [Methylococcaceae bacterium]
MSTYGKMLLGIGLVWVTQLYAADYPLPEPAVKTDFPRPDDAKTNLGRLLFYDKILSGNRNISCATCHHALTATGDGWSLSVGEGGLGLGVARNTGQGLNEIHARVPRNAPPVFNLGAASFDTLFADGRVQADAGQPSGFKTPAGDDLPTGILENVLAAQAMFPVTSGTEMAGQSGENDIANLSAVNDFNGVWQLLAERLRSVPEYVALFQQSFPEVHGAADITYAHAANAIAAFEGTAWRCDNSRFDQYLRGRQDVLSAQEKRGVKLFYGKADCAQCHSGTFQTDGDFHAIAMPQIGPGKGDNLPGYTDGLDDFGRERVTKKREDRFKFRTPSLRMVEWTGPWGHDGAYNSLEGVVRHHLNATAALKSYDTRQAVLPLRPDLSALDFVVQNDPARRKSIAAASEIQPIALDDREVADLMAFLFSLTDHRCTDLRRDVPQRVPSGLTIAD